MRVFEHPNLLGDWRCRICGTADDSPVTLVSKDGTENGNKVQADQYHIHCLDLGSTTFPGEPEPDFIYMRFKAKGE